MKVSVRVRGEWFAIPCEKGTNTVRWLGEEALRRYQKIKPESTHVDKEETIYEVNRLKLNIYFTVWSGVSQFDWLVE